jgi:hypothetical protein
MPRLPFSLTVHQTTLAVLTELNYQAAVVLLHDFSSPPRPGHHHVDIAAASKPAADAIQALAPIPACLLGGLAPVTKCFAPYYKPEVVRGGAVIGGPR